MKPAELIDYCLTFKGSYLDFPFGEQCACIRVGKTDNRKGRIFAQVFNCLLYTSPSPRDCS